jgi:hypothetical protein
VREDDLKRTMTNTLRLNIRALNNPRVG